MKTRKELKLRPLRPAFLDVIPRLPAMICKKEILFRAFSPISYVFSAVKSVFKRRSAKYTPKRRLLFNEQPDEQDEDDGYGYQRKVCEKRGTAKNKTFQEKWTMAGNKRQTTLKNTHSQSCGDVLSNERWSPLIEQPERAKRSSCLSCEEDRAAYKTCSFCQRLRSTLPSSSCSKCQARGPVVKFCMGFHGKQPKIYVTKNYDIYKKFTSKRILPNRKAAGECSGKTPSIYNCPLCLTLWPTMGECSCRTCRNSQPIVKFSLPQYLSPAKVELCPCSHCSHLHPKIRICDLCRSANTGRVQRSNSIYVMLP